MFGLSVLDFRSRPVGGWSSNEIKRLVSISHLDTIRHPDWLRTVLACKLPAKSFISLPKGKPAMQLLQRDVL